MSKKILIITGDAGESYETLYALHRFQEAEYEPVLAAPSKRRLNLVMHDFEPGWDATPWQLDGLLTWLGERARQTRVLAVSKGKISDAGYCKAVPLEKFTRCGNHQNKVRNPSKECNYFTSYSL